MTPLESIRNFSSALMNAGPGTFSVVMLWKIIDVLRWEQMRVCVHQQEIHHRQPWESKQWERAGKTRDSGCWKKKASQLPTKLTILKAFAFRRKEQSRCEMWQMGEYHIKHGTFKRIFLQWDEVSVSENELIWILSLVSDWLNVTSFIATLYLRLSSMVFPEEMSNNI